MKSEKRKSLIKNVINLASLPPGKRTIGYFTRYQLVELINKLKNWRRMEDAQEER